MLKGGLEGPKLTWMRKKGDVEKDYLLKEGLEGPKLMWEKGDGEEGYLLKEGLEGPKLTGGGELICPEGASHAQGPVAAAASAWGAESCCV